MTIVSKLHVRNVEFMTLTPFFEKEMHGD
jgi:hypothetical protein